MPLAPTIAAALTTPDATARYRLEVAGVDVSHQVGGTLGQKFGLDPSTLLLSLAGPGGTSRLECDVDDPALALAPVPGDEVRFAFGDEPWFLGTLELDAGRPDFGGGARRWHLTATGVDGLPDWVVTEYDLSFPSAQFLTTMIQAAIAACSNTGPLTALVDPVNHNGSDTLPLGNLGGAANLSLAAPFVNAVTIPAGTTLRAAWQKIIASSEDNGQPFRIAIDMRGGVRLWSTTDGFGFPGGTVAIGTTSTPAGADHAFSVDGTAIVRTVVVIGTGARATVSDGTGRRGRSAVLNDPTLTTTAACAAAGRAYLASRGAGVRGTIRQESVNPAIATPARVPLGQVAITDASVGATGTYESGGVVVGLDQAGLATLTYAYGGRPPAASELIRQMAVNPVS
jgi:hypothetical protein